MVEEKTTLGELDFIIREVSSQVVFHIELTYKFYLLDNSIEEPIARLVGPNRKDTFVAKLNKTKEKQMPLLYSAPSRMILEKLGLEVDKIVQRVAFYGHVFLPYGTASISIDGLNEECNVGSWINRDQFEVENFGKAMYYHPKKYEWLHIPHIEVEWKIYSEILDEIDPTLNLGRSPMLWMKQGNQLILKLFVTPSILTT